jgi:hypothetical protein
MACREILDRAYGKPEQAIAEGVGVGMSKELREFIEHCEGRYAGQRGSRKLTAALMAIGTRNEWWERDG